MLKLVIPPQELYDEKNEEFITIREQTIQLEHSLVSVSKWESKWKKSYLANNNLSGEELVDYIRCMTITQNVKPEVFDYIASSKRLIQQVTDYINDPMTATTFSKQEGGGPKSRKIITSEELYQAMIANNIPVEFQKWHLNRLMTLIRVCGIKSKPPKKMSRKETARRNSSLNAARKKKWNTSG